MYHIPLPLIQKKLELFVEQNGHCLVRQQDHVDIGTFVSRLCLAYTHYQTEPEESSLTPEQINKLNKLGFVGEAQAHNCIVQPIAKSQQQAIDHGDDGRFYNLE